MINFNKAELTELKVIFYMNIKILISYVLEMQRKRTVSN